MVPSILVVLWIQQTYTEPFPLKYGKLVVDIFNSEAAEHCSELLDHTHTQTHTHTATARGGQ